jgi:hypothetical protein
MNKGAVRMGEVVWKMKIRTKGNGGMINPLAPEFSFKF